MVRSALVLAFLLSLAASAAEVTLDAVVIPGVRPHSRWADFNGDGLDDLLYKNELQWNLGGRFSPPVVVAAFEPDVEWPSAIADFNNDGLADFIITASGGGPDRLLLGDGSGGFHETAFDGGRATFQAADFTGDGTIDLILYAPGTLTLLRGNGDGTFELHQKLPWAARNIERNIVVGDASGDGFADVIVPNEDRVTFYFGSATGVFSAPHVRFTRWGTRSLEIADLNADGRPDLTFLNRFDGVHGAMLLAGDGRGRFPVTARFHIPRATSPLAVETDPTNAVTGDLIAGGGLELAHGQANGVVRILSAASGELREVASVQVSRGERAGGLNVTAYTEVRRVSFRAPGGRDLIAEGQSFDGPGIPGAKVWSIDVRGTLPAARAPQRSRSRATGRTDISADYDVQLLSSDCPFTLAPWKLRREGMFVDVVPDAVVRHADAVYIDGSLWLEITIADRGSTRVMNGLLRPVPEGFSGLLFESGTTPCGGSQRHLVTLRR